MDWLDEDIGQDNEAPGYLNKIAELAFDLKDDVHIVTNLRRVVGKFKENKIDLISRVIDGPDDIHDIATWLVSDVADLLARFGIPMERYDLMSRK